MNGVDLNVKREKETFIVSDGSMLLGFQYHNPSPCKTKSVCSSSNIESMSRGKRRRLKRRQINKLRKCFKNNKEVFERVWWACIETWIIEFRKKQEIQIDEIGRFAPPTKAFMAFVLDRLRQVDERAFQQYASETQKVINEEICECISKNYYRGLNKVIQKYSN